MDSVRCYQLAWNPTTVRRNGTVCLVVKSTGRIHTSSQLVVYSESTHHYHPHSHPFSTTELASDPLLSPSLQPRSLSPVVPRHSTNDPGQPLTLVKSPPNHVPSRQLHDDCFRSRHPYSLGERMLYYGNHPWPLLIYILLCI